MFSRFWTSISLLTLTVGTSSYLFWRYYQDTKKDKRLQFIKTNTFTIDRVVDPDCNGQVLSIGINGLKNSNYQGIRLGEEGEIKKLLHFSKKDDKLEYEFEDNVKLSVYKTEKKGLMYSLETPNKPIEIKDIDNKVQESWKTISMTSDELDELLQLK
jgi:hypothetical protein